LVDRQDRARNLGAFSVTSFHLRGARNIEFAVHIERELEPSTMATLFAKSARLCGIAVARGMVPEPTSGRYSNLCDIFSAESATKYFRLESPSVPLRMRHGGIIPTPILMVTGRLISTTAQSGGSMR
jgi:hypothetical protein